MREVGEALGAGGVAETVAHAVRQAAIRDFTNDRVASRSPVARIRQFVQAGIALTGEHSVRAPPAITDSAHARPFQWCSMMFE